jgi:ribonuclease R
MSDDYYLFNEKAHTMKGDRTGRAYRLGDRVEVQVAKVDLELRKIDFALVDVIQRTAASGPARRPRNGDSGRDSGRSASRPAPRRGGGKAPAARRRAPRRRR